MNKLSIGFRRQRDMLQWSLELMNVVPLHQPWPWANSTVLHTIIVLVLNQRHYVMCEAMWWIKYCSPKYMFTVQPVDSINMNLFRTRVSFFQASFLPPSLPFSFSFFSIFVINLKNQNETILDYLNPPKANDKYLWKRQLKNGRPHSKGSGWSYQTE